MVVFCKECNGVINWICEIKKNGAVYDFSRCGSCGREIKELIKHVGVEYK